MDGAILVVAGMDGPMPQTREHLLLANQVSSSYTSCCNNYLKILAKPRFEKVSSCSNGVAMMSVVVASCDEPR